MSRAAMLAWIAIAPRSRKLRIQSRSRWVMAISRGGQGSIESQERLQPGLTPWIRRELLERRAELRAPFVQHHLLGWTIGVFRQDHLAQGLEQFGAVEPCDLTAQLPVDRLSHALPDNADAKRTPEHMTKCGQREALLGEL